MQTGLRHIARKGWAGIAGDAGSVIITGKPCAFNMEQPEYRWNLDTGTGGSE